MPHEFNCPNCGAPLDAPQNSEASMRCPFCNTSIIVPEELRKASVQSIKVIFNSPESAASFNQIEQALSSSTVKQGMKRSALGCSITGITLGILILAGIFSAFMMTLPGGPLAAWWSGINPFGTARVTLSFGGEGSGPGLFTDARAIAVDNNSGNIYVAEYQGGRVQAFDAQGKFLLQWTVGDRKTIIPSMSADRNGNVYIAAAGKILKYEGASGNLLEEVSMPEENDYCEFVLTTPDGGLFVIGWNESINKLNSDYAPVLTIPEAIETVSGDSELDTNVAVDGEGNIYALGSFNYAVFKFDREGKFLNRFGSQGDEKGQFRSPYAIAVDGQGRVFVSDVNGILVFDSDGRYLKQFDAPGAIFGMVFNDTGELLVTSSNQKVYKYTIK